LSRQNVSSGYAFEDIYGHALSTHSSAVWDRRMEGVEDNAIGAPSRIRTCTTQLLRLLSLPDWTIGACFLAAPIIITEFAKMAVLNIRNNKTNLLP
jgi:hypothetical protein